MLFFTLPLELNDDLRLLGDVYRWALAEAKIEPVYQTKLDDPGILICPTALETGTLYVLTSESSVARDVRFRDVASGRDVRVELAPGRAALLLVTRAGEVVFRAESAHRAAGRGVRCQYPLRALTSAPGTFTRTWSSCQPSADPPGGRLKGRRGDGERTRAAAPRKLD